MTRRRIGRQFLIGDSLLLLAFFSIASAAVNQPPPPPPRDAAIFPLVGNVYPDGIYYVSLQIGDPPKPYFLDVDTGSDLTWIQCDAPCVHCAKGPHPLYKPSSNKLVPCQDPLCVSLQVDGDSSGCANPTDQCDYEIEYSDSGSSLGVLVADYFTLRLTNGSLVRPALAFGCGYDQQDASTGGSSPTDGVIGLGLGRSGVLGQLRNRGLIKSVIGHCLGRRGGGFLFLGDALVPRSGMTWTPMSCRGNRKYYMPGPAALFFGKQPVVQKDFQVVFDSGSSYAYFSSRPYELFVNLLMKDLNGKPIRPAPEDKTLPLCWKGNRPIKSLADVKRHFSSLALVFSSGKKALFEIPPENYLILSKFGNVCMGILNGTEAGLGDLNVIGDISLQDRLVIYDNEQEQIGWASTNCDRSFKFGNAPR